jgi:hypothetical protein
LQPGLLLNQPLKSLQVNSFQLIKFCCTLTVPAAETKSIGLQADAQVVMVFAALSGLFYHDMTNPAHLSGLIHLDNFAWTRKLPSIYRDFAKTHANPDTDGNSIKPPAVIANVRVISQIDYTETTT